ncbi:hypothetical protein GOP47_0024313 [Adiantum capillus-veneris]|uniref:Uncharacterized protein n=1 Tax=Adiantum capillus-veneris TaxID=13818 RepID=A0A9D4U1W9_ADICA|nr:hypothetical protein GOP47_0024313 [Adiantum capillus-veneris]
MVSWVANSQRMIESIVILIYSTTIVALSLYAFHMQPIMGFSFLYPSTFVMTALLAHSRSGQPEFRYTVIQSSLLLHLNNIAAVLLRIIRSAVHQGS